MIKIPAAPQPLQVFVTIDGAGFVTGNYPIFEGDSNPDYVPAGAVEVSAADWPALRAGSKKIVNGAVVIA